MKSLEIKSSEIQKENSKEIDRSTSFPVKISTDLFTTEDFYKKDSHKQIFTDFGLKEKFTIEFVKGCIRLSGYSFKRRKDMYKLKGWKLIGITKANDSIILDEIHETKENVDCDYYTNIRSHDPIKSIELINTEKNWDDTTPI